MPSSTRYLNPEVVAQVQRLDLRARFIVEGFLAGLHRSPFQGLSIEFAEHRKYTPGDDLRTLDWAVFARTDRLYVRRFATETHLDCHLLIDSSASMGRVGPHRRAAPPSASGHSKLDYAVHLAAALAYIVTRQRDSIGLGVLGTSLQKLLPPRSRRADLIHLLATLAELRPSGETDLSAGIGEFLQRTTHRGLIVVLSDLLTDPQAALRAFRLARFRGHDLIVMHVLDDAETTFPFDGVLRLEDPESGESVVVEAAAARETIVAAVSRWRAELAAQLASLKADYVPLHTAMPFDRALAEFLAQRARRR